MTREEAIIWIINLSADLGRVEYHNLWHYEQALDEVRELLEVDAVPVVRCKNCRFSSADGHHCEHHRNPTLPDAFCSAGRVKE